MQLEGYEYFAKIHELAGCANSSSKPNADFVDIRFDTVLQARFDLKKGTEVLTKYSFR